VCVSPIHRLCAVDVGQDKGIVSAVADTRKVTTVSANQPMVEAYPKEMHRLITVTHKHPKLKGNRCLAADLITDTKA
jgi:hypothetical protein